MPVDLRARLLIMESLFDCIILLLHFLSGLLLSFYNTMCYFFVSRFRRTQNKIMKSVEAIANLI